ncbi:MAG: carboxyl transferase domain-containing protein [Myxococcota bacterium]
MAATSHKRLTAPQWFELLLDDGKSASLVDPVPTDPEASQDRLTELRRGLHLGESFVHAMGTVEAVPVVCGAFDFRFLGGSLGVAAGDRILHALHAACSVQGIILVCQSGGVRVQEGVPALLQMPRLVAARIRLAEARRPLIVIAADPTLGGVAASLVATADVIFSEPKARLGLSGRRASEALHTASQVYSAEDALSAGLIDQIVPRHKLRQEIAKLLRILGPPSLAEVDPLRQRGAQPLTDVVLDAARQKGRP